MISAFGFFTITSRLPCEWITSPAAQDRRTCPCRSEFHTLSNYRPPTPMQDYNRHLQHLPSLCITFHIATAFLSHRLLRTCSRMQMQREAANQSFLQHSAQLWHATEEYPSLVIFLVYYVGSSSLPAEGGRRGGEDVSDQFTCKYYYPSAPKRIKRKQLP